MTRTLNGRRVLITGASRGIGRALAQRLAREGSRLVLAARSEQLLRDLERSLGRPAGEVLVVTADITQQSNQIRLIEQAVAHFGGLDVLVNNAGVASWGHFAESTEAILRQVMEVNFFAPAELIRLAIPVLVKGEQPAIVNIASMCGRRAMPAWTEYSASKYALCGLTEALRGELARFGIDILLIVPGLTASEFSEHFLRSDGRAQIDFGAGMAPETLARRVVHSLKKNRTESIIGRDARWILLVNKFFPWLVDYLLARKVQKLYA